MGESNKRTVTSSNVDLLRVVANELKLPLTNIHATSSMLVDSNYSGLEAKEQQKRLLMSSEQAIDLVDALLLAGRVQSSQLSLELSPVSASSVARDVAQDMKELAARYDKAIRVQASQGLGPVSANRQALGASLKTMLDSIVRSSRSEVIEILVHKRLDKVIVSLKDRGDPITNQTVSAVLRDLGKSVQPAKSLPTSSGLSIYVSTVLMEAMNGSVDAYSRDDRRTVTFSLSRSKQLTLL